MKCRVRLMYGSIVRLDQRSVVAAKLSALDIGVDYGGDGGDMSPLFEIRILSPPLLKMCKPIATYSTKIVESKIMR